jgi:ligand-binding sensor domain-containing protein
MKKRNLLRISFLCLTYFIFEPICISQETGRWEYLKEINNVKSKNVFNLFFDSKDNLWISHKKGLSKLEGGSWTDYEIKFFHFLFEDRQDNIWIFASVKKGYSVFKFNGKTRESYFLTNISYISTYMVSSRDEIWIGGYNKKRHLSSLYVFKDDEWENYTSNDVLPNFTISVLFEDSSGTIFGGTCEMGGIPHDQQLGSKGFFFTYDGIKWKKFDESENLQPKMIDDVYGYTEPIDCSMESCMCVLGIFRSKNDSIVAFSTKGRLVVSQLVSAIRNYHLIISGYTDNTWKIIDEIKFGKVISTFLQDSHGNIWIGTDIGVFKFDGINFKKYAAELGFGKDILFVTDIIGWIVRLERRAPHRVGFGCSHL